jgi:hypothetical protein
MELLLFSCHDLPATAESWEAMDMLMRKLPKPPWNLNFRSVDSYDTIRIITLSSEATADTVWDTAERREALADTERAMDE